VIRRHLWLLALLALTGIASFNTIQYIGLQHTLAMNGLLIGSASPLIIALWTLVLFGERLTGVQAAGLALSLAGVLSIITRGELADLAGLAFNQGDVWLVGGAVIYAFYSAYLRRRPPIHPISFLAVIIGIGALLIVPFAVWEASTGYVIRSTPLTWGSFLFVATVPSLLAFVCFNRGIELIGANRAGPFFHLVPAIGAVLAVLLLGEEPALYHAAGFALILSGIALTQRRGRAA
jgi:drug/metabolite transporter (DMT)-like permease